MPIVENPDGTLWIDIEEISEVDAVCARLVELGVTLTAFVTDPACNVTVEEVEWVELYPKIVPGNGPEPGMIVQPAEIPEEHTLLPTWGHTMTGAPRDHEPVLVLSLIRSAPPPCYGIISRQGRPPSDPRLRPARPPSPRSWKSLRAARWAQPAGCAAGSSAGRNQVAPGRRAFSGWPKDRRRGDWSLSIKLAAAAALCWTKTRLIG
jgi:hypothetical protein